MRASRDTDGRCAAAFGIPWNPRAAGVSSEGVGLGEGSTGRQDCGLRPPADYAFGVTLEVRAVGAYLGRAFGSVRLTGRLAARLCCVRRSRKCV